MVIPAFFLAQLSKILTLLILRRYYDLVICDWNNTLNIFLHVPAFRSTLKWSWDTVLKFLTHWDYNGLSYAFTPPIAIVAEGDFYSKFYHKHFLIFEVAFLSISQAFTGDHPITVIHEIFHWKYNHCYFMWMLRHRLCLFKPLTTSKMVIAVLS